MSQQPIRDRLAADIATYLDQEMGADKKVEPKGNPFGSIWHSLLDLLVPSLYLPQWGRIVDVVPMMNSYRVQAENGQLYICSFCTNTSHQPTGVRQTTTLTVGTGVLFVLPPQGHHGLIIAVDPDYITDPRNHRMDMIVQGGRTGLYVEAAHDALLTRLRNRGDNPCFNAGRPLDSTSAGEWGYMAETGLGIHMDPFLTYLRVDEETGLFLFYHDQLARLAGHNLQVRSALGEKEELDDQLELIKITGSSPYPWERKGAWAWCQTNFKELSAKDIQKKLQEYSLLEPVADDQQPWDRIRSYGGYLGQGHKQLIALPPYPTPELVNTYSDRTVSRGVLNIQHALDGSLGIESAKRIYISKRACIPVPKMIIRPEDERGDNETNYKAAGMFGTTIGEQHIIADQFDTGKSQGPLELVRATAILDLGAFTFNWQGLHPFHYHRRDWYVPEECDGYPMLRNQLPPNFCDLQQSQYLSAPPAATLHVDHREGDARYYPNESLFVMLEDGGIVIGDGFGSEIRMTGGSIELSAPGDINIRPGKNLNVYAGWDVVLRANNSVDATANHGDFRAKAEHNIQILGGNDGYGGVLIESKANCPSYDFSLTGQAAQHSGILLLARNSPIATYSADLVLKTKVGPSSSGTIRLQAGDNNEGDIKMYCMTQESFLGRARFDFFTNGVNEFWSTDTFLSGHIRATGSAVLGGGITSGSWITVTNGGVSTVKGGQMSILPADALNTGLGYINSTAARANDSITNLQPTRKYTNYERSLDKGIIAAEFSYRTADDYQTQNGFIIFESRWQQMARLGGVIPDTWTEKPVFTRTKGDTYPHPGKDAWATLYNWYEQDLTLYSMQAGASIDRGTNQKAYEHPAYGQTTMRILNGSYPIIRNYPGSTTILNATKPDGTGPTLDATKP
jgi:hypothetical protein